MHPDYWRTSFAYLILFLAFLFWPNNRPALLRIDSSVLTQEWSNNSQFIKENYQDSSSIIFKNQSIVADSLHKLGLQYYDNQDYQAALLKHQEALQLALPLGDKKLLIAILLDLGQVEFELINFDDAENYARRALEIAISLKEQQYEADAFRLIADISYRKSELDAAEHNYLKALRIMEALKDSSGLSIIFNNLGNVYSDRGELEKSIEFYNRALNLDHALREIPDIGKSIFNIGLTYLLMGNYSLARTYLDSAKAIFTELHDRTQLGMILGYSGVICTAQANYPSALKYLEQGLSYSLAAGDSFNIAVIYGGIGDVYLNTGKFTSAIQFHFKAGCMFQKIGSLYNVSASYLNIGQIYFSLGDYDRALSYYQKSLKLKEEIGEQYGIGLLMGNLGALYLEQDSIHQAISAFNRSLQIGDSIGDKPTVARTHENLGAVYFKMNEYEQAKQHLETALQIFRAEQMQSEEAGTLIVLGDLFSAENDTQAVECYNKALLIGEQIGHPQIIWNAHAALGYLYTSRDELIKAREHFQKSIEVLESIRSQLATSEQRSCYFATKLSPYQGLIHVLSELHKTNPEKGYDGEAFIVAEKSKARSFVELLTESKAEIRRGLSEEQKKRERTILYSIAQWQSQLLSGGLPEEERNIIIDRIQKEEENLSILKSEMKKTNPFYLNLKYPDPISFETLQHHILKEGSLFIEFYLGKEKSWMWVISNSSARIIELPVSVQIEIQAQSFLQALRVRPTSNSFDLSLKKLNSAGQTLFTTLFSQAMAEIASARHLIIAPDGILYYLPFEALPLSDSFHEMNNASAESYSNLPIRYFISQASFAYVPSATALTQLYDEMVFNKQAEQAITSRLELLAFGDPAFRPSNQNKSDNLSINSPADDLLIRSLSDLGQNILPLPSAREEVKQIATLFPSKSVRCFIGVEASEERVKSEDLALYRYIHFATHGFLDERFPDRNGLLLSCENDSLEDGLLQMNEIFNLDMKADLVVLSACESGLGKLMRGEGMVGLTRAFQYAGARSLVVSLWKVADASTAELMKNFYTDLLNTNSNAAALREAKLLMLKSPVKLWRHPFHWAGFILHGEEK